NNEVEQFGNHASGVGKTVSLDLRAMSDSPIRGKGVSALSLSDEGYQACGAEWRVFPQVKRGSARSGAQTERPELPESSFEAHDFREPDCCERGRTEAILEFTIQVDNIIRRSSAGIALVEAKTHADVFDICLWK